MEFSLHCTKIPITLIKNTTDHCYKIMIYKKLKCWSYH